jgi:lipoate-protein ligase A
MKKVWRFIDSAPMAASLNMATDEAISIAVRKGNAPPTLRIYGWDTPSVSMGYFQSIKDIDTDACFTNSIPVVRRITGGRAILHGEEITYSFSVQTTSGSFAKGLRESYKKISLVFGHAFSLIGLNPEFKLSEKNSDFPAMKQFKKTPLCFQSTSYGEITQNNLKIIGSAQKRWNDALLQQGSIPLTIDMATTMKVFRIKSPDCINSTFIGLKTILPSLSLERLKSAIKSSFQEIFKIDFICSSPSDEEIALAEELEMNRYLSKQWNFMR